MQNLNSTAIAIKYRNLHLKPMYTIHVHHTNCQTVAPFMVPQSIMIRHSTKNWINQKTIWT